MATITFRQLPLVVKIAVGLVFLNAWVLVEQLGIEPYGIWKYMPYYKVGDACVWDLMVTIIVSAAIWRASPRKVPGSAA